MYVIFSGWSVGSVHDTLVASRLRVSIRSRSDLCLPLHSGSSQVKPSFSRESGSVTAKSALVQWERYMPSVPRMKGVGHKNLYAIWKAIKEYLNHRGTKIRIFRVCFWAPVLAPFFPHFPPLFPLQALFTFPPLLPPHLPLYPPFFDSRKTPI